MTPQVAEHKAILTRPPGWVRQVATPSQLDAAFRQEQRRGCGRVSVALGEQQQHPSGRKGQRSVKAFQRLPARLSGVVAHRFLALGAPRQEAPRDSQCAEGKHGDHAVAQTNVAGADDRPDDDERRQQPSTHGPTLARSHCPAIPPPLPQQRRAAVPLGMQSDRAASQRNRLRATGLFATPLAPPIPDDRELPKRRATGDHPQPSRRLVPG